MKASLPFAVLAFLGFASALGHRPIALPQASPQAVNVTNAAGAPTFYRDVLPILQKNCQSCHRPGQIAPMPFVTYDETKPFASAIAISARERRMPPWFADPRYGHFSNDPSLTSEEIKTLVAWAD